MKNRTVKMQLLGTAAWVAATAAVAVACSGPAASDDEESGGSGGQSGSGGVSAAGTSGVAGAGGSAGSVTAGFGGATAGSSGATAGAGGATAGTGGMTGGLGGMTSGAGGGAGVLGTGGVSGTSGIGGGPAGSSGMGGGGAGQGGATNGGAGQGGAGQAGSTSGGAGTGGNAGAAGSGPTDCMIPPPPSTLVGWATEGSGTTGGGDGTPVVVTSAQQLSQNLSGNQARVIHVNGNISGSFNIGSNKTVIGVCDAEIHGHIGISGSSNVILRNLKIVGNNCTDAPQDCSAGADAVGIGNGAHHIWADHLDVSDGSDGNFDITSGADFVTVSWTKFSYSTRRTDPQAGTSGHRFSNLIGSSDTDPSDVGHLNITYHHCWWAQNVDQRMTRSRRGQIHHFNNLFTSSGNSYCTNAGQDAKLLVENCVYNGVNNPLQIANNGTLRSVGNDFTGSTGNQTGSGNGFTPTYAYTADPTSSVRAMVEAGAGPQ